MKLDDFNFFNKSLSECSAQTCSSENEGHTLKDKCGQECSCVNGELVECTRIRKEFTSMTTLEQERYILAIKTVSTDPSYKTDYETFLTQHKHLFTTDIHQKEQFLPWHRWFILDYENLLRRFDCRVTVSYWDWSLVAADPWGTEQGDLWYGGAGGFGGNGMPPDSCVETGPFK